MLLRHLRPHKYLLSDHCSKYQMHNYQRKLQTLAALFSSVKHFQCYFFINIVVAVVVRRQDVIEKVDVDAAFSLLSIIVIL